MRLMFSTLAYVLIDTLRRKALKGTDLARAQATRIRLELLKIGAVVLKNTRRIIVHLSSGWPPPRNLRSGSRCTYLRQFLNS